MPEANIDVTGLALMSGGERKPHGLEEIAPGVLSFRLEGSPYRLLQDWNGSELPPELTTYVEPLARALTRKRADLVFLVGFGVEQWLVAQAAALRRIPVAISHHGVLAAEAGVSGYDTYPPGARRLLIRMERDVSEQAAVRIFLNQWSRDQFSLLHNINARPRSRIIPIPYNDVFDEPVPLTRGWTRAPMNVGWVARWDRIKRPSLVAQTASASPRRWRWNAVTTIRETASVPEATRKQFVRRFRVLEPMSPTRLADFYAKTDALMLPSAFDVSPTVVLEAALRGRLTVLSKHTGWTDAYREAELDHLLCDSTPSAMLAALESARDDREGTERLRTLLRERHEPARVFAAHAKAFRDALS